MGDDADAETHEGEDRPHPACVATGEVVVHGHHMHPTAANGVDAGTERTNERLPLAGTHLGDLPLVQHDRTEDLLVVRAHPRGAARCFARRCENLWQLVVERCL